MYYYQNHDKSLIFLDLHLQISWNQSIYFRWRSFCPTFFVIIFVLFLSKTTKLNLIVSLHEEVCTDFNFNSLSSFSLSLSLSLPSLSRPFFISLSFFLILSLFLSLSLSFFLFLSKKITKKIDKCICYGERN